MLSRTSEELVRKARNYQISNRAVELLTKYPPQIISGVTASGKNAIISYIVQRADYEHVVTHTTRPIRSKETTGVDHWFVDDQQMGSLIDAQALIEAQAIHGDSVYGVSFAAYEQVVNSGHKPILDMDVQGVSKLTEHVVGLTPIFILPPSFDVWMERLGGRDTMSDGERQRRFHSARVEIEEALRNKKFIIITNHEVDDTAHQIMMGVSSYAFDQQSNRDLAHELIEYLRGY